MLILGKESICSTLASEVRADTTQRFKEMKQLPTDTPSHVKALNKMKPEKRSFVDNIELELETVHANNTIADAVNEKDNIKLVR